MPKTKTPIVDQVTGKLIEPARTGNLVRVQISITHGISLSPAAARALAKRLKQIAELIDPSVEG